MWQVSKFRVTKFLESSVYMRISKAPSGNPFTRKIIAYGAHGSFLIASILHVKTQSDKMNEIENCHIEQHLIVIKSVSNPKK